MKIRVTRRNRRGPARRGVGFSFFVVIVMSTLLGFASQTLTTQSAKAAQTAYWIDILNIATRTSTSQTFYTDGKLDSDYTFTREGDPDKCADKITIYNLNDKTGVLQKIVNDPAVGCKNLDPVTINLVDVGGAEGKDYAFTWNDQNKISRVDGTYSYIYDTKNKLYYENETACKDTIEVDRKASVKKTGKLIVRKRYSNIVLYDSQKSDKLQGDYEYYPFKGDISYDKQNGVCWESKPVTIKITNVAAYNITGSAATKATNGNTAGNQGDSDGNINGVTGGSDNYQCVVTPPLSWIACPIITLMVKALGVLEGGIKNALQVPPLGSDGAFQSLHTTWAAFRDLANAFLVLIFLITIFAQVLPFDVDPYMVKKVLPKIIAAAICIQFSYFFVQVLFDISRILGAGIGAMIKSLPVGDTGGGFWGQEVGDATVTSGIGFIGAVAAGGVGLAAAFEAGGLLVVPILLLLLSAIISVITLFVTLQMRMIVLFIMTMIAPLAFLAWILPNTENYFKKWGTTLIKLLLMYPLIVFMIDSANMIAKVSYDAVNAMSKGSSGVGGINDISKLMISVIPIIIYFMIPMTFKWAGGIFGSIANAVQNQGNKWSKQARNNAIMKNSLDEIKTNAAGRLPEPDEDKLGFKSAFSRKGFGRLGSRTVSGNIFSFGNSGRRKIEAARSHAEEQLNAGLQVKYRKMNNIRRLQAMLEAEANGNEAEAAAIFDLILKQGGDLEASEYFATLEYEVEGFNEETGKIVFKKNADGTLVRRADADKRVVRSSNGAVESVKSSLWTTMQRNESHAKRLASAVPSSVGKPISKASAGAHIESKGDAPATEFITEARQLAAEGKTDKLAEIAQNFTQIIQRENAGEMQEPMVNAWREVARILKDNEVETTMLTTDGEVKVYDLIEARSKDNKLQRYVQGTPTGAPVVSQQNSGKGAPPPTGPVDDNPLAPG